MANTSTNRSMWPSSTSSLNTTIPQSKPEVNTVRQNSFSDTEKRREVLSNLRSLLQNGSVQELRSYVNTIDEPVPLRMLRRGEDANDIVRLAHMSGLDVEEYLRQNAELYEVDGEYTDDARQALDQERRVQWSVSENSIAKYSEKSFEEILDSFRISNVNDPIHVQRSVFSALVNEGFFGTDGRRIDVNAQSGMLVETNRSGIDEAFYYSNFGRYGNRIKYYKLATIRMIPDIINGGFLKADDVANIHNKKTGTRYAYIEKAICVDGDVVVVEIAVRKSAQKNKFWMHKIEISNGDGPAGTSMDSKTGYYATVADGTIVSEDLKRVNTNRQNSFSDEDAAEARGNPEDSDSEGFSLAVEVQKEIAYTIRRMGNETADKVMREFSDARKVYEDIVNNAPKKAQPVINRAVQETMREMAKAMSVPEVAEAGILTKYAEVFVGEYLKTGTISQTRKRPPKGRFLPWPHTDVAQLSHKKHRSTRPPSHAI